MICDLAETYHILDYKSLSPSTVAILVAGLRENSRLNMEISGVKASQEIIFLAAIADKLSQIVSWATGSELPHSLVDWLINGRSKEEKNDTMGFVSPSEFMKARYGEKTCQQ